MSEQNGLTVQSPLHEYIGRSVGRSPANVVICEAPICGHLIIRGNTDDAAFGRAVASVMGLPLPEVPGTFGATAERGLYWLGPDEWLALVEAEQEGPIEAQLRRAYQGHMSIVSVSGGQTLLNLSGIGVPELLQKSSGYDFHLSNFAIGRCAQTTFAKATALVSRCEDNSFNLVIRRSFAHYLAQWLLDAGKEYGCRIE